MRDIIQILIDDLKRQCSFYTNGVCQTRGCLVRGGWKPGDPVSFSQATCLPKEQAAVIERLIDNDENNKQQELDPDLFVSPPKSRKSH
jgi:hypothetical protein